MHLLHFKASISFSGRMVLLALANPTMIHTRMATGKYFMVVNVEKSVSLEHWRFFRSALLVNGFKDLRTASSDV